MVKRVEKLFLRTLLADDELDIVNQQDVVIAVLVPELSHGRFIIGGLTFFQGFNQFVGKCLACNVENLLFRVLIQYKMSDGMHQMGLPKTDVSI